MLYTHSVLVLNSVVPEMDEVDNVCVFELYESLEYLD